MEIYLCRNCNMKFEAKGGRVEWIDATFGPCSKLVAKCPECGADTDEYRAPKQSVSNQNFHNHTPACGSCCGGCGL
jgi:hypothetical protein